MLPLGLSCSYAHKTLCEAVAFPLVEENPRYPQTNCADSTEQKPGRLCHFGCMDVERGLESPC